MKKLFLLQILITSFLVTGCVQQSTDANIFEKYLIFPFRSAIEFLAIFFDHNYGLAIVLLTLMIRFALLPLMMDQYKKQKHLKNKMDTIRPHIEKLQEELKATKETEKQMEIQQEMMKIYKSNEINPLNIGCLPLIIQMPVLMGFYYAIRNAEHIGHSTFLWFSLGESDWILTAIAGVIYYLQFRVTQANVPEKQQAQMKYIGLISPIMIIIISSNAPAALPLYWVIGGIFLILQSLFCQKLYS